MPFRDFLVLAGVFAFALAGLVKPWVGVCGFAWISYMNPHRLSWSTAYSYPVAMVVVVATLAGVMLGRDRLRFPKALQVWLLAFLWCLFSITTAFALNATEAGEAWIQVSKVFFMTFLTIALINDRRRLHWLLFTIVWSVGLLGIKGAVFSIASGGAYRVYGPPGSFLADNNDFAHAMCMTLPLFVWLASTQTKTIWKNVYRLMVGAGVISTLTTYSRGGFITLLVVLAVYWVRSRRKLVIATVLVLSMAALAPLLPSRWYERMSTIDTYRQDASVLGRFNAWHVAWNVALDRPLLGGGFRMFTPQTYSRYAPDPNNVLNAHSIYFEVLGEHGFIGFCLFLVLVFSSMVAAIRLKSYWAGIEDRWAAGLAEAVFISLIAYLVGGIALGRAYFDLMYHLVAVVVILKGLKQKTAEPQTAGAERAA